MRFMSPIWRGERCLPAISGCSPHAYAEDCTYSQIVTFFRQLLIKFPIFAAIRAKNEENDPNTTLNTSNNDILLTAVVDETYDNGVIRRRNAVEI